jgi:hypothetical protein
VFNSPVAEMPKRRAPPPARVAVDVENDAPMGAADVGVGAGAGCAPLPSPIVARSPLASDAPAAVALSDLASRLDALTGAFSRLGERDRAAASGAAAALASENAALTQRTTGSLSRAISSPSRARAPAHRRPLSSPAASAPAQRKTRSFLPSAPNSHA